jgi:hypothetical protein
MRSRQIGAALVWTFALTSGALRAEVQSGLQVGSKVEPLKAIAVTGESAGKEIDFAAERKEKPTIFVFIQAENWDRPMARFLRTLDQALAKDRNEVRIIAVWLTDDVAKAKDYLPKAQESLKLSQTTFAVYDGDKNGPGGWGINPDAHCTALVVQDQKVSASFGFRSLNETDAPAVLKTLKSTQ